MTRIEALAAAVRADEADAMLLTGEVNLIYATTVTALEGQCIIFADGRAVFATDGRYTEIAEQRLTPQGFQVLTRSNACSLYEYLDQLMKEHGVQKLMYEDDVLTVAEFAALREYLSCTLVPVGKRIRALRQFKSEEELHYMRKAQRIAEEALHRLIPELHTGMTEREAAARLNYYMASLGSEKPSFDTILLFGENTSKPHGVPSDRTLRPGDFVLADFGAVCEGYHSDMTRTFAYGKTTDEMVRVYSTVLSAQAAAMQMARPGILCCDMHQAAANVIEEAGYGQYFTHALGHSVGLEIHEMPVASPRCKEPLQPGIVMTDEPGIYLAGKFGVRIEDMLVIREDAPEDLAVFPKELMILPEKDG